MPIIPLPDSRPVRPGPYVNPGTPPFQSVPPPMPAGCGLDQQQWSRGVRAQNTQWDPHQDLASSSAWDPGASWGPNPAFTYPSYSDGQLASFLPYKRQPKPPSAEYISQPITNNGLHLESVVEAHDRYGDEARLAGPTTPWAMPLSNDGESPSRERRQISRRSPCSTYNENSPGLGLVDALSEKLRQAGFDTFNSPASLLSPLLLSPIGPAWDPPPIDAAGRRQKHRQKHERHPLRRVITEPDSDPEPLLPRIPDGYGYDSEWRKKNRGLREREEAVKRKELELVHKEEEARRRKEETNQKESELLRKEKEARQREEEAKRKEMELERKEEEARRREEEAKRRGLELVQKEEEARRREEEIHEEISRFEEDKKEAKKIERELREEIKRFQEEKIAARQREEELRERKEKLERSCEEQLAELRKCKEEIRRQEAEREEVARKERDLQRTQTKVGHAPCSSSHSKWTSSQNYSWGSSGASLLSSPTSIASYSTIREEGGEGMTDWQRRQEEMFQRQQEQFRKEQERLESPRRVKRSSGRNAV